MSSAFQAVVRGEPGRLRTAKRKDYYVISITGRDRPGITSAFARILKESQVRILDVEQATLQDILALSFLVDLSSGRVTPQEALKDLLYQAKQMALNLDFRLFPPEEMIVRQSRYLYTLTCISSQPMTDVLARIAPILAEHNINIVTIRCLAERLFACIEMVVDASHSKPKERIKQEILAAAGSLGIDLAVQRENLFRRSKRLLVFDMDRTLVAQHTMNELAKRKGVEKEVERLTEQALSGVIDYRKSLEKRVALLRGLTRRQLMEVARGMSLNQGVERLLKVVQRLGYKVALISGGIDFFTSYIKQKLQLDYAFGNTLQMKNGRATGKLQGKIIDAAAKARILNELALREKIHPEQVVAIGDGVNDVLMLSQAGLGIAYHAKPVVAERADARISEGAMLSILYLLGISERDLAEIEEKG